MGSHSSVGQTVRLITVRSAVQVRVGASFFESLNFCSLIYKNIIKIQKLSLSLTKAKKNRWHHWSSGYDVRLTRGRSPVQSWDDVVFVNYIFVGNCKSKLSRAAFYAIIVRSLSSVVRACGC